MKFYKSSVMALSSSGNRDNFRLTKQNDRRLIVTVIFLGNVAKNRHIQLDIPICYHIRNENDVVGVYNYVTIDTFDAYMMNIIVTKQKFISQLLNGEISARSCEDVDDMVLNYTEMQVLATGDPRIKEKIELDTDVARLKMLENEQYRLDDVIKDAEINIKNLDQMSAAYEAEQAELSKTISEYSSAIIEQTNQA